MAGPLSFGSLEKRRPKRPVRFPTLPLYAAFALIGIAVSATVFGTVTGIGTVRDSFGAPVAIRDIQLVGGVGEEVQVIDARTDTVLAVFPVEEGGFVRGSLRALSRIRLQTDVVANAPYRLIRWQNGAVSLSDTVSGERIYLNAFGPDNAAAFAELLDD
ncbi:MAG: phosphonoacetaldehyde hydrolase [Roseibium sp.]|nr:phosphonoacetaldehyde hydrolase [Roseibium sp.]